MRMNRVMLTVAMTALLAACAGGLPSLLEPQVELRQVVVRGIGLQGGSLDLVVDVDNPNGVDLRVVGVDAGLETEQGLVGRIRAREITDLPAQGRTQLVLPLRFEWTGLGDAFRSALGYGDLPYRFRGQVSFAVGDRIVSFPFTREGRVPLGKTITLPSGSPR